MKKIRAFLDQFQSLIKRNFGYLEKNGVFKFFGSAISPPITTSANSVTVCQEACLDYDQGPGCKYFTFDASKEQCQLFSSSERICDLIRGPPTPSYEECSEMPSEAFIF